MQQTFNVKQLFSHEGFSIKHLRGDIALLQLDRPAQLSEKVNLVCLPQKGSRVAAGTRCFITGIFSRKARADGAVNIFEEKLV